MANFYIEKIIASGDNKEDAVITFTKGLNIINGISETGKSCILKYIYFMFGGSNDPFDVETTGYSTVKMIVAIPHNYITFERSIGKNQILVSSDDDNIYSGKYDIRYKKNGKNPLINSLLLKLIGIDEDPMIIFNKNFERCRLTWKTFMKILYLSEDNICTSKSILELMDSKARAQFLSSILYLLTGNNASEINEQENQKIQSTRKSSIQSYINKHLIDIANRRKELSDQLDTHENIDIIEEIEKLVTTLTDTEKEIIRATEESKDLLSIILELKEKETECEISFSQYQSLKSQYSADIKRLSFIVNGQSSMQTIPKNTQCPFCEGEIETKNVPSYIDSARGELARIFSQLEGLTESEADILRERNEIKVQLAYLKNKKSNLEELINHKLKPYSKELKNSIENYRQFLELSKELDIIQNFEETLNSDLHELISEVENKYEYRLREYFDDKFKTILDNYAYFRL